MIKAGKWTLSEAEFERQFAEATRRGEEAMKTEITASHAYYDPATQRLVIELKNGATHSVPCQLMQGLRDADPADIAAVELGLRGASLHWEKLDNDFTVGGLVRGIYGTKKWMEQLARKHEANARAKAAPKRPRVATAATATSKRGQKTA